MTPNNDSRADTTSGTPSPERIEAAGKMSEALEWVERARGRLYDFHQMMGRADILLGEAIEAIGQAGAAARAAQLRRDLYGRDVLEGRWTYMIVEEFDDGYWSSFRDAERAVRDELVGGRRHLLEAGMRRREQVAGH